MPKALSVGVTKAEDRLGEATFSFEIEPDAAPRFLNEALEMSREIKATNTIFRDILYRINRLNLYDSYVDQLSYITSAAFSSSLPDLAITKSMLAQVQEDFVMRAGQRLRLLYIRRMFVIAASSGVPALLYGAYLFEPVGSFLHLKDPIGILLRTGAWTLVGIALSTWVSAVLRNRQLSWETLTILDPDGFPPVLRFGLVAAITSLLALLLYLDVIRLGVGTLDLGQFYKKPSAVLLLGIIGGLGEGALTKYVIGRIQSLATSPSTSS